MKKQLIIGVVLVIGMLCAIIEIINIVLHNEQYFPTYFSEKATIIIGIVAFIFAIASLILGVWLALKPSEKLEKWAKPITFSVSIPLYFLLAILPVFYGLVLIILTRQITWGFWLSCLSFASLLILLVIALRKTRDT